MQLRKHARAQAKAADEQSDQLAAVCCTEIPDIDVESDRVEPARALAHNQAVHGNCEILVRDVIARGKVHQQVAVQVR